ncbi:MAG: beta-phosphoglucomutase [Candidatus Omnitrophica bacterium]|nr:beta-phosphoglucomutase [Candidatus Omnitrophota bacterium]MBU1047789.1 beta-phosphoglucomutase [Candidatus Omnitrophota bacterium]MBU1630272.1 beta-phosphoglucomutase [Candidatus Omnitrophota bacterium]MBU1766549.1 beta-phosphoglucomutase [Candidatus Omnitrophota bacterium]MBU1889310.1 beta-phosphoglucomutase [Candidatus Omnitrophota bacterium]
MARELKAVIFDLDGVITDTARFHYQSWKKIASGIGINLTYEFNEKLKGVSRMESLDLILTLTKKKFSEEKKIELADEKNRYYLELVRKMTPSDLLPGAIRCFEVLKNNNIKIVLASASKNSLYVIRNLKVEKYFDYMVDSRSILKSKPDPEIFIKAAESINAAIINCVGVEDSIAGILAINACNMFSVGIGNKKELYKADICIKDLTEFNIKEISLVGGFS